MLIRIYFFQQMVILVDDLPSERTRRVFISEKKNSEFFVSGISCCLDVSSDLSVACRVALSRLYCVVSSDCQMKINADPRKMWSSFKDQQCLTIKVFLKVFLTCVYSADERLFFFSFFLIHTKVQPEVS